LIDEISNLGEADDRRDDRAASLWVIKRHPKNASDFKFIIEDRRLCASVQPRRLVHADYFFPIAVFSLEVSAAQPP
jgi:hypothetical protein